MNGFDTFSRPRLTANTTGLASGRILETQPPPQAAIQGHLARFGRRLSSILGSGRIPRAEKRAKAIRAVDELGRDNGRLGLPPVNYLVCSIDSEETRELHGRVGVNHGENLVSLGEGH